MEEETGINAFIKLIRKQERTGVPRSCIERKARIGGKRLKVYGNYGGGESDGGKRNC